MPAYFRVDIREIKDADKMEEYKARVTPVVEKFGCHGTAAKGDGPAASAMKTAPSDLTLLAKKNGGKYPSAHVASVIRGQGTLPSHGSQDMPVWGPLFSSISQGHEAQVQQRTANLVAYIETLQAK